jgi:hypothetical protein
VQPLRSVGIIFQTDLSGIRNPEPKPMVWLAMLCRFCFVLKASAGVGNAVPCTALGVGTVVRGKRE